MWSFNPSGPIPTTVPLPDTDKTIMGEASIFIQRFQPLFLRLCQPAGRNVAANPQIFIGASPYDQLIFAGSAVNRLKKPFWQGCDGWF
ncbi:hypothetical protein [Aquabacterium sp.]|uniref:hypothetical protein n=1 Tax=Aquabacterium sp. TaxID=1872578 RepID=UPI0035AFFD1B